MTRAENTPSRRRNTLLAALERLRQLDLPRGFHAIILFLYVCENEGVNISELAFIARMRIATVARIVKVLAGLVPEEPVPVTSILFECRECTEDRRVRFVHLSARGQVLRDELETLIAEANPILPPDPLAALTRRRA